jgi:hypothetical protein
VTLSTLAQIRSKMEKAEKLLRERQGQQGSAFVISFSTDTAEQTQAKVDKALNGRDPETLELYQLIFEESAEEFALPGEGKPGPAIPAQESSGMLEELQAFKRAEQAAEMNHATADEKLDAKAMGVEPPRTGLTRRADR